ncbi:MAG: hypothetical protein ABIS01_14435 [Ferruginibacter sp.]
MKKTFTYLLIFLLAFHCSNAQFYKSFLSSGAFSDSLSIIVQDFKNNFLAIEGNQLTTQAEMEVYQSKATVPGALHSAIFRFHSLTDPTASWQAIMYESESHEEAMKIYKNTVRQLLTSKMKWADNRIVSFTGKLEVPRENPAFAVTTLKLNIPDKAYRIFFAEVELTNSYYGWEVHLNLHNKRDDAEQ